jgi:hypothetical protein
MCDGVCVDLPQIPTAALKKRVVCGIGGILNEFHALASKIPFISCNCRNMPRIPHAGVEYRVE